MTAGWVAPTLRGRALMTRWARPAGAAELAASASWPDARKLLAELPYGAHLPGDADRRTARRTAEASAIWQLRVLAGWLPPGSTGLVRIAAAPFEIANIDGHVAWLAGAARTEPLTLGSLALAWPRVARTSTLAEVRAVLAHSAWGDPGGVDPAEIALALRVGWARRAVRLGPIVRPWAHGALALLAARERFGFERSITHPVSRDLDRALGRGWRGAASVASLADCLAADARWVLADVGDASELWRAEVALIRRVTGDATPLIRASRYGRDTVIAMLALTLVDVWRVSAAVEAAGSDGARSEVLGDVAP